MAVQYEGSGFPKFNIQGDAVSGRKFVKLLRWVCDAGAVAGDALVVLDSAGNVIWESVADGAYFIDIMPVYKIVDGIVAQTLPNGKLYAIYG